VKKTILEEILLAEQPGPTAATSIAGVVLGRLAGLGPQGQPMVDFTGNRMGRPLPAVATSHFTAADIGVDVALVFENGDPGRPVVIGPVVKPEAASPSADLSPAKPEAQSVTVDGERITFDAEQEIVLRCGASSITLTRAGKIILRGKYILSRSAGVNRIKGASIQLN
jgi:hypothetical protein